MPWFTKQRKKKARNTLLWFWGDNFGFSSQIQGRFQPVSAISDMFRPYQSPADRPDMADMARFWPNQLSLAQIEADSAWIEPHGRESSRVGANPRKKKKKLRCGCDTLPTASVLSSRWHMQFKRLNGKAFASKLQYLEVIFVFDFSSLAFFMHPGRRGGWG